MANEVRAEGEDAVSIAFTVPPALATTFRYTPGQYLTVRQPGSDDLRRSYSLCSAPSDHEMRIGVREIPGGAFSTWANRSLTAGMALECLPPEGNFCPTITRSAKHYVLFAVGSGITPCLSIAKTVLLTAPTSQVTLVYGNRRASSTMFREDLEDLKNRYLDRFALHCVFSREAAEIDLYHGRIDAARVQRFLERLIPPPTIDEVFLCGPNQMLETVEAVLVDADVTAEKIHIERFGVDDLAPVVRPEIVLKSDATVTLIVDGAHRELRLTDDTLSILDAARAAGLDLPFSCKSGVCATCRARVLEGEVHMARNFGLLKSDLAAGIVLTCQARPITERVVLSFDER
ncbi:MAG: 2Fe-2S iron-sulfur cluster binding domain-containing protein [Gammaproteobacteria bacterium]|nr:2Fe-2S iron-sulfur cluster binding domain-containing protein [Gammaproteobacteria bacterium]